MFPYNSFIISPNHIFPPTIFPPHNPNHKQPLYSLINISPFFTKFPKNNFSPINKIKQQSITDQFCPVQNQTMITLQFLTRNQQIRMDIGFIEEKDRENIFQLMETCAIDMNQAYLLYNNAHGNLEVILTSYRKPQKCTSTRIPNNPNPITLPKITPTSPSNQCHTLQCHTQPFPPINPIWINLISCMNNTNISNSMEPNSRITTKQENKVVVSISVIQIINSVSKMFSNKSQKQTFKQKIQTYYFDNKPCRIKLKTQSLSQILDKSQKFPIIVYIFDFNPKLKNKISSIFNNPLFQNTVNVQFYNFGIDPNYQIQQSLKQFVNRENNNNSIVILRVNIFYKIQIVLKISITDNLNIDQIVPNLKKSKSICINRDLQQGYLDKRLSQELRGNFNYVKPLSPAQRNKINQDRKIRQQQEKQFYDSMKADEERERKKLMEKKQQGKKKQENKSSSKLKTNQQKQKQKQKQPPKPVPPKRNLTEQRKKIRDKLKIYKDGMRIKLRLPDGQSQILTVSKSQTIHYLFNYIKSIDKDIGFQNDEDRKFTILRPYDKLNLSQYLNKTLQALFEGSDGENLVVNEETNS